VSARQIARPGAASHQSLEASRGAPAPADPDAYYRVEPGETAPEYWRLGLGPEGMDGAIRRAAWLSVAGPAQRLLVTRPAAGHRPACRDRVIKRYRGGNELSTVQETGSQTGGRS